MFGFKVDFEERDKTCVSSIINLFSGFCFSVPLSSLILSDKISHLSPLLQLKPMVDYSGAVQVPQSSSIIDFAKSTFSVQILLRLLSLRWPRAH